MSDKLKEIEARLNDTMPLTAREGGPECQQRDETEFAWPSYIASFETVQDLRWLIEETKRLNQAVQGEYICSKCFFRNHEGEKPEADF